MNTNAPDSELVALLGLQLLLNEYYREQETPEAFDQDELDEYFDKESRMR